MSLAPLLGPVRLALRVAFKTGPISSSHCFPADLPVFLLAPLLRLFQIFAAILDFIRPVAWFLGTIMHAIEDHRTNLHTLIPSP
eukprot:CAMPEP_0113714670 /NCGR_PEP_ID=MMETSP0038_2-20120614/32762_1 /TAXON_ID=2898 /ORGANISM="Cryptomonas paramecium" /LENGTH=83 /DNA_ID=CAMNT_0000641705 /DNA_START=186 /DNA_END=434 /DNA_ORIENTATION=+ /assembly_acc=CAM_ASM_000170